MKWKWSERKILFKTLWRTNIRKIRESLYIFLATPDEVEKYAKMIQSYSSSNCVHQYNTEILNLFDLELQLINTKPMIKSKLKKF